MSVDPAGFPKLYWDLRGTVNGRRPNRHNLANFIELSGWIQYQIDNEIINPLSLVVVENGLHVKQIDTGLDADSTVFHLGGNLIENTTIDLYDPLSTSNYYLRIYDDGTSSGIRGTTSFSAGTFSHSYNPQSDGLIQSSFSLNSTGINAFAVLRNATFPLSQPRTEFQMQPDWWELRLTQTAAASPILAGSHTGVGGIEMHYDGSNADTPTLGNWYRFPRGDGTGGYVMYTDGLGQLGWTDPTAFAASIIAENGLYEPVPGTVRLGTNPLLEPTRIELNETTGTSHLFQIYHTQDAGGVNLRQRIEVNPTSGFTVIDRLNFAQADDLGSISIEADKINLLRSLPGPGPLFYSSEILLVPDAARSTTLVHKTDQTAEKTELTINGLNGVEIHFAGSEAGVPQLNNWYRFPYGDGNPGDIMQTNGSGIISWQAITALDTHLMDTNQTNTTGSAILHDSNTQNWGITNLGSLNFTGTGDMNNTFGAFDFISGGGLGTFFDIDSVQNMNVTLSGGGGYQLTGNASSWLATGISTFQLDTSSNVLFNAPTPLTYTAGTRTWKFGAGLWGATYKLEMGGALNQDFNARFRNITLECNNTTGYIRILPESGVPAIGDVLTAVNTSGDIQWTTFDGAAITPLITWGSGLEETVPGTIDWNGALTKDADITGASTHDVTFRSMPIVDLQAETTAVFGIETSGDVKLRTTKAAAGTTAAGQVPVASGTDGIFEWDSLTPETQSIGAGGPTTVTSFDKPEKMVYKTAITGGGDTVRLPNPSTLPFNRQKIIIKDTSGNAGTDNITIDTVAGNIDGGATALINQNYMALTFISDGTDYWII